MNREPLRAQTCCIMLLAVLCAGHGVAAERVVLCEEFSNVF